MTESQYLESLGLQKVKSITYPNTFAFQSASSFSASQITNRDQSGWKKAQHIIIEEATDSTQILPQWQRMTNADPWQPSIQFLYLKQNNNIYKKYNAQGEEIAQGTLEELFINYQFVHYDYKNSKIANDYETSPDMPEEQPTHLSEQISSYLAAIRSKPFILLAGISGTGKSRLARQLAQATANDKFLNNENFLLIPVKPNWHDSTELLGYVSRITGQPEFILTDFIRFVFKALFFPEIPFFCCLDEMNLAPVEQYFAEYLSVIETRTHSQTRYIESEDPLIKISSDLIASVKNNLKIEFDKIRTTFSLPEDLFDKIWTDIVKSGGIKIPHNLVIIGTVNMDETTFSFSRKVLDRAMSFELNEVDLTIGIFEKNDNLSNIKPSKIFSSFLSANDIYNANSQVARSVLNRLFAINAALNNTPFKIAYRSRNEIMIYVFERLRYDIDLQIQTESSLMQNSKFHRAMDEAISMKILSRIEGDEQRISCSFLQNLQNAITSVISESSEENIDVQQFYPLCNTKLSQMRKQLQYGFVSFWS